MNTSLSRVMHHACTSAAISWPQSRDFKFGR